MREREREMSVCPTSLPPVSLFLFPLVPMFPSLSPCLTRMQSIILGSPIPPATGGPPTMGLGKPPTDADEAGEDVGRPFESKLRPIGGLKICVVRSFVCVSADGSFANRIPFGPTILLWNCRCPLRPNTDADARRRPIPIPRMRDNIAGERQVGGVQTNRSVPMRLLDRRVGVCLSVSVWRSIGVEKSCFDLNRVTNPIRRRSH